MLPEIYWFSIITYLAASYVVSRVIVRRSYLRLGHLGATAVTLEFLVCVLYFAFPYIYNPPGWATFWSAEITVGPAQEAIGTVAIVAGAALAFPAMGALGFGRSFGRPSNQLKTTGFYSISRNPQVVGGALMPIGAAIIFPSWYAMGWLLLYGAIFHMMIRTEEEHLQRVFGEEYEQYRREIPRYVGLRKRRRS